MGDSDLFRIPAEACNLLSCLAWSFVRVLGCSRVSGAVSLQPEL